MYGRLRKTMKIVYNSLDIFEKGWKNEDKNSRMIKHYYEKINILQFNVTQF